MKLSKKDLQDLYSRSDHMYLIRVCNICQQEIVYRFKATEIDKQTLHSICSNCLNNLLEKELTTPH